LRHCQVVTPRRLRRGTDWCEIFLVCGLVFLPAPMGLFPTVAWASAWIFAWVGTVELWSGGVPWGAPERAGSPRPPSAGEGDRENALSGPAASVLAAFVTACILSTELTQVTKSPMRRRSPNQRFRDGRAIRSKSVALMFGRATKTVDAQCNDVGEELLIETSHF
jgi:hypothetical protein